MFMRMAQSDDRDKATFVVSNADDAYTKAKAALTYSTYLDLYKRAGLKVVRIQFWPS